MPSVLFLEDFFEYHHTESRYFCKLNGVHKHGKAIGIGGMPAVRVVINLKRRA
jgi:hypothetical protein